MIVVDQHAGFVQQYSRCVATIGKFDGVHKGHQAILDQVKDKSKELSLPSLVILIEPHPEEFFATSHEQIPARLNKLDEKLVLLESFGVDFVYLLKFDLTLSQLSAESYIDSILIGGLGIAALIIGNDFRFGFQRKGDFALLKRMGQEQDFEVIETASCTVDGVRVSSTYVREQLEAGDFELVQRLLGRPYIISGEVIKGKQLGTELGFPTCNINLNRQRIPLHGIYACEVKVLNQLIPAAVNIGYRPTVTDVGEALLEAYLLDFEGDLYGEKLQVIFRKKIREEQKFEDLATLKQQISIDVQQIREFFGLSL